MRRTLAVLLLLVAPACSRCARDTPPDDGQACARACAGLTSAGCDRPGLLPSDAAGCASACLAKSAALAGARCDAERRRYLECVARAEVACDVVRSAANVAIELADGISGCDPEHAAYRTCAAPCDHAGTRHVAQRSVTVDGREREAGVEIVRAGCAECPAPGGGAPPGSNCQSPKVCAERCCECDDRRVRFAARVCVDGACAGDDACRLARAASSEPCAQPR